MGHVIAQTTLGGCFLKGLGVLQDKKRATEWYEKAVTQGDPEAMFQLGRLLKGWRELSWIQGDDCSHRAKCLIRKAAELGHSEAEGDIAETVTCILKRQVCRYFHAFVGLL